MAEGLLVTSVTHTRADALAGKHYNDPIPAIPAEANLDNELYKLWGWLGGRRAFSGRRVNFWHTGELID